MLVPAVGCGGAGFGGDTSIQPSSSPGAVWGPLAVVPPRFAEPAALFGGTVRIDDECVYVEDVRGNLTLLVWPADKTEWDSKQAAIRFRNRDGSGVVLRNGDEASFTGGGSSVDEGGGSGGEWIQRIPWMARPAASCQLDSRWDVVAVELG